jgi:hypothetical protein
MDVSAAFGAAWTLYRRNVAWLVLAGILGAIITGFVMVAAWVALAAFGYYGFAGLADPLALDRGAVIGATNRVFSVPLLGFLVGQVLVLVLEGGMLKMAIDSSRDGQTARLDDLFAGFRRFPTYLLFWLVAEFALPLAGGLAIFGAARASAVLAIALTLVGAAALIWLYVTWLYVVPLIADRGLGFAAAVRRSRRMVGRAGWWNTFGALALFAFLVFVFVIVYGFVFGGGNVAANVLSAVAMILVMPYALCFIAVLYLRSEAWRAEQVLAAAPAPPGSEADRAVPSAESTVSPPAPPGTAAERRAAAGDSRDKEAEAAAWAAAADPLAHWSPPVAEPAGQPELTGPEAPPNDEPDRASPA